MVEFGEMPYVSDGRDTTRCDYEQLRAVDHLPGRFDVWTFQNAVAGNIGINHEASAQIFKPACKVQCSDIGIFGPARNLYLTAAGINTDRDVVRPIRQR